MDLKDSFGSKIFFHYIIQIFLFLSRSCFHEIKFKGSMNNPRTRHSASTLTRTRNSRRFVNLILCASVGYPSKKKISENTMRVIPIRVDTTGSAGLKESRNSVDTSALLQMKTRSHPLLDLPLGRASDPRRRRVCVSEKLRSHRMRKSRRAAIKLYFI